MLLKEPQTEMTSYQTSTLERQLYVMDIQLNVLVMDLIISDGSFMEW